jgi:hypothetical protein
MYVYVYKGQRERIDVTRCGLSDDMTSDVLTYSNDQARKGATEWCARVRQQFWNRWYQQPLWKACNGFDEVAKEGGKEGPREQGRERVGRA